MPKNIIICSDGTGNTAIKDRGTNVFKMFEQSTSTDIALTPISIRRSRFTMTELARKPSCL